MKRHLAMITVLLLSATPAFAHDESSHGRKPTEGVIDAVHGDHLSLRSQKGTISVVLDEKTAIEQDEKPVGRDRLEPGARVSVFGTKLPGGEIVARDIVVSARRGARAEEHRKDVH
jgi:hypothetical protein